MNKTMYSNIESVSIILPAFNEEGNIVPMIEQIIGSMRRFEIDYEIIVVNDGSTDKTADLVKFIQQDNSSVKLVNQKNKGYGGALKAGFNKASKQWVFFTDSDLQFDTSQIDRLLSYTDKYNFVFGYRAKRADGKARKIIELGLKVWDWAFLGVPLSIKDIDCAFKLMRRASLLSLGNISSDGAMVSTELIIKILHAGYKIKQVAIDHYPRQRGESSGSNPKVIIKAIKETFLLKKLIKRTTPNSHHILNRL